MTRRRGFTLIELLLALSMVAMLTLAVYTGLSVAVRARNVAVKQTESLRQAKAALDLVEQELRSVPAPGGILAGAFLGTAGGAGDAAAASLDFYSLGGDVVPPTDGTAPIDGVRHVLLALSSDGTTPLLTRTLTRNLIDPSAAATETDTLARDVQSFGVRYYDGEAWADAWDSTQAGNTLPPAIEVTVAIRAPTATDPLNVYRMTRTIPMTCGTTPASDSPLASTETAPSPPGLDTGGGQ